MTAEVSFLVNAMHAMTLVSSNHKKSGLSFFYAQPRRKNADTNSHFLLILIYKMITSSCMYLMDTVVIDLRKLVEGLLNTHSSPNPFLPLYSSGLYHHKKHLCIFFLALLQYI